MVLVCMEFHKKGGHSNCCRILSYCVCQLFFVPIRWERHVSVLYLPFKQESGGLLLLDEDRTRSVNMLTATWCWTANRMFKSLRWMCLCSGNKCFGCGDWSNHSEGFRHGPSMNFIVWDVFLDSPRCFWLFFSSPFPHFWTHWTHFEEVIRSDFNCTIITIAHRIQTLFLGQIRTDHTVKLQCLKRRNQCLNLSKFNRQVGLWQGCSLWRRKSGRVWLAPGARLQWNMSNSALENFPKHCEKIISCTFIILSGRNWWRRSPSSKRLPKKGEQCDLQSSHVKEDKLLQRILKCQIFTMFRLSVARPQWSPFPTVLIKRLQWEELETNLLVLWRRL